MLSSHQGKAPLTSHSLYRILPPPITVDLVQAKPNEIVEEYSTHPRIETSKGPIPVKRIIRKSDASIPGSFATINLSRSDKKFPSTHKYV